MRSIEKIGERIIEKARDHNNLEPFGKAAHPIHGMMVDIRGDRESGEELIENFGDYVQIIEPSILESDEFRVCIAEGDEVLMKEDLAEEVEESKE